MPIGACRVSKFKACSNKEQVSFRTAMHTHTYTSNFISYCWHACPHSQLFQLVQWSNRGRNRAAQLILVEPPVRHGETVILACQVPRVRAYVCLRVSACVIMTVEPRVYACIEQQIYFLEHLCSTYHASPHPTCMSPLKRNVKWCMLSFQVRSIPQQRTC